MRQLRWPCALLVACANARGSADGARPKPASPAASAQAAPPSEPAPAAASGARSADVVEASVTTSPVGEIGSGRTASTPSGPVVIVAGGDVSFAREVGQRLLQERDYEPLAEVDALWRDADVRFVNLESQLSFQNGETQSPRHRLIFTGPPEGADALARARITLVSTANNHAWDYGRSALLETLYNLDRVGVRSVGTGSDLAEATRVVTLDVKGMRIAWLAVTHVWNQGPIELHEGREHVAWADIKVVAPIIQEARRDHDYVILSYHGGGEYLDAPAPPSKRFLEAAIDAGVDFVIGHHPHVIPGIGFHRGRPSFYSLGNLVFGVRPEHPWTRYGMLAKVTLARDAAPRFAVCPYAIAAFTPKAFDATADEKPRSRFLAHLKSASTSVGGLRFGEADPAGCVEVLPPLSPSPGDPPRAGPEARPLARR
jgi:poly-gamma-glutamate synthesis protein (capsule biosynthesis protein)